ncbi:MAG TPA: hypothetical protein PKN64_00230 [Casimicrobium sp.]|nr:hypothetical protein [Casimicrobium sp.]
MAATQIVFPEYYAASQWEIQSKGYFSGAKIFISETQYRLNFYEPARLAQEIVDSLERGEVFFEPNLIVVETVTRREMQRAVDWLEESGQITRLVPENNG